MPCPTCDTRLFPDFLVCVSLTESLPKSIANPCKSPTNLINDDAVDSRFCRDNNAAKVVAQRRWMGAAGDRFLRKKSSFQVYVRSSMAALLDCRLKLRASKAKKGSQKFWEHGATIDHFYPLLESHQRTICERLSAVNFHSNVRARLQLPLIRIAFIGAVCDFGMKTETFSRKHFRIHRQDLPA